MIREKQNNEFGVIRSINKYFKTKSEYMWVVMNDSESYYPVCNECLGLWHRHQHRLFELFNEVHSDYLGLITPKTNIICKGEWRLGIWITHVLSTTVDEESLPH